MSNPGIKPRQSVHQTCFRTPADLECSTVRPSRARACHVPAIFKSVLYEACGRIVNPTYGSVGMMWSGSWDQCQAAVDAVLEGPPITGIDADALQQNTNPNLDPPHISGDIRYVSTDTNSGCSSRNKARTLEQVEKETGLAEISKLLMIEMERPELALGLVLPLPTNVN
ncbi:hypothetical protein ACFX13_011295 [Malus domestica]